MLPGDFLCHPDLGASQAKPHLASQDLSLAGRDKGPCPRRGCANRPNLTSFTALVILPVHLRLPLHPCARYFNTATMNLLLSDDYLLQDYPDTMTNTIRSGHTTMMRFDCKGDYLATGRGDGVVVVWDLETMGVARKLRGHQKTITFLSWSRCGRYLLSTCQGWKAILWDLQDGSRLRDLRFRAPLYMGELHPSSQ